MSLNAPVYRVARVRFDRPRAAEGLRGPAEDWAAACRDAGLVPWGAFAGLLGLRTDEAFLVAAGAGEEWQLPAFDRAEVVDQADFAPTVRPVEPIPQHTPGVYVFRTFDIRPADLEEFVRLSAEAWESFESGPGYRAEPRALLRRDAGPGVVRMLLITWYDSLQSWERSRTPPPAARANFQRRAALTRWALPIAARLI